MGGLVEILVGFVGRQPPHEIPKVIKLEMFIFVCQGKMWRGGVAGQVQVLDRKPADGTVEQGTAEFFEFSRKFVNAAALVQEIPFQINGIQTEVQAFILVQQFNLAA